MIRFPIDLTPAKIRCRDDVYYGCRRFGTRELSTTTVPSAFVIFLIRASVEPATFDGKERTVISSPGLRESLVIPSAIIEVTEAISPTHCMVFPVWSFTSQTTKTWGFLHLYSATIPFDAISSITGKGLVRWRTEWLEAIGVSR